MFNLNQNGFSFLRLLANSILVLLLFAAFLIFVNPIHINAGALQDTDQIFKDISDGKLNAGAQEWIKKNNSEEDYEWIKEYFGEDNANKFYNNEYIQSGKAGSPVINDLLGTGVDVVVGTYGGLGGNTPSLGEVIELSWWQKAALGIKDIYGAVKNIFRVFGPSNKEMKEATPGQIGKAVKSGYQDCPSYMLLILESTGAVPTTSSIQTKIESLKIGIVSVREIEGGKFLVSIRSDKLPFTEEAHQQVVKAEQELGLQETKVIGGSAYQAKDCLEVEQNFLSEAEQKSTTPQPNIQTPPQTQTQQGKVAALVISPDGQSVYQAKFWLIDSQGRNPDPEKYEFRYTTQTGRLETLAVPNGQYTLNITCELHCMFGDKFAQSIVNDVYAKWSKTLPVEVKGSDIWLDKINLIREK